MIICQFGKYSCMANEKNAWLKIKGGAIYSSISKLDSFPGLHTLRFFDCLQSASDQKPESGKGWELDGGKNEAISESHWN